MPRWKSIFLNQWRAKIAALVVAALLWLVLRHAITPLPAGSVPAANPGSAQIR